MDDNDDELMIIRISFKKKEKKLFEDLKESSKYIGVSGFVKKLIANEIEKNKKIDPPEIPDKRLPSVDDIFKSL